jgi:hypothetical protein
VWGALRVADFVLIPYIPTTAGGQRQLAAHRRRADRRDDVSLFPIRYQAPDSRAQGIISAVAPKYSPLEVQSLPPSPGQRLDYRDKSARWRRSSGSAAQHVNALADTVLNVVSLSVAAG